MAPPWQICRWPPTKDATAVPDNNQGGAKMTTLTLSVPVRQVAKPRVALWLAGFAILAALLAVLTKAIIGNPTSTQDLTIMTWVAGWNLPGLDTLSVVLSALTSAYAGLVYGPAAIAALFLMGKRDAAVGFGVVGLTVALVAVLGDYTLGELVDRGRPLAAADHSTPAFPSTHVFGSTVFFGFIGFLAIHYHLNQKLLLPLLSVVAAILLLVGPSRIYEQAHYPSDVAAGYLLGALWLLVVIPTFVALRNNRWMPSWQQNDDISVGAFEPG